VHAQLAVVNGAGRRGHLSREIEQVTFREERERERESCCQNGSGLLRRESEWCRKEETEMRNNNDVCLRCEKKVDPGW
jgi:hypothetical protein